MELNLNRISQQINCLERGYKINVAINYCPSFWINSTFLFFKTQAIGALIFNGNHKKTTAASVWHSSSFQRTKTSTIYGIPNSFKWICFFITHLKGYVEFINQANSAARDENLQLPELQLPQVF